MASFNVLNYSLRPSKSIQRTIIFDAVRSLQTRLNIEPMVYIGLGSIWFSDFISAHKMLKIASMVSVENDEIGYARARFNKPFSHVEVHRGSANLVLPKLFLGPQTIDQPTLTWLDYDSHLEKEMLEDIQVVLEGAQQQSLLLVTFNANKDKYGKPIERTDELRELFGDLVPDSLDEEHIEEIGFQNIIADLCLELMLGNMLETGRSEKFLPAFRVMYRDTTPMVTVGGLIVSGENTNKASALIDSSAWRCKPSNEILAPNLTIFETIALRAEFPRLVALSRNDVRSLGFDLEEEQLSTFGEYYREFPVYAEIFS